MLALSHPNSLAYDAFGMSAYSMQANPTYITFRKYRTCALLCRIILDVQRQQIKQVSERLRIDIPN